VVVVELSPEERRRLGQLLVALRKRHQKVCVECGQPYMGLGFQLYCSVRCQRRARKRRFYWRHRETELARLREYRLRKKAHPT
jgi:hypothetical protein